MSRLQTVCCWFGLAVALLVLSPFSAVGQILVADWYSESTEQVVEFNNDGTISRAFTTPSLALQVPAGMAVGAGSDLFISSQGTGEVLRYDWRTGAFVGAFASNLYAPSGLLYDPASNSLYVNQFGNLNGEEIVRYNATTGDVIARFGVGNYTGAGMAMDANGKLYVSDVYSNTITRFDPANHYAPSPFAQISNIAGINGLAFDNDGNLNVTAGLLAPPHAIYQVDAQGVSAPAITSGLNFPSGIALGADGNLLVANMGNYSPDSGSVGKYDPNLHTVIDQNFLTNGDYFAPSAVALEPNTAFWTGGAAGTASDSWKNADNWWHAPPANGAAVCFGAIADGAHTTNNNDFDPLTAFGGITFTRDAPAYILAGNSIKLAGPVINQSDVETQTISLGLELISGGGLFDTGANNIAVGGDLSGSGALVKRGTGTLTLGGAHNTAASTTVVAGMLDVAGTLNSTTITVAGGAQLTAAAIIADTLTIGGPADAACRNPRSVPEPGTFVLVLLAGLTFVTFPVRRRR
jgi:autotransporter-associated beta strand protein